LTSNECVDPSCPHEDNQLEFNVTSLSCACNNSSLTYSPVADKCLVEKNRPSPNSEELSEVHCENPNYRQNNQCKAPPECSPGMIFNYEKLLCVCELSSHKFNTELEECVEFEVQCQHP